VATATSVNGVAQGSIPVTATPNIANGTGGSAPSPPVNSPQPNNPPANNPPANNPPANDPATCSSGNQQQANGGDGDHSGQHADWSGFGSQHHFETMWHHA